MLSRFSIQKLISNRFASSGMKFVQFTNAQGQISLGALNQAGKVADLSTVAPDLKVWNFMRIIEFFRETTFYQTQIFGYRKSSHMNIALLQTFTNKLLKSLRRFLNLEMSKVYLKLYLNIEKFMNRQLKLFLRVWSNRARLGLLLWAKQFLPILASISLRSKLHLQFIIQKKLFV